jgi:transcriptional regulator with XRE-family HTH domain
MAKEAREQFGRDLREARLRAGLSQTNVGQKTLKGQAYVSEIEAGKANVTLDTMFLMADAVGLEVVVTTRPTPSRPKASSSPHIE